VTDSLRSGLQEPFDTANTLAHVERDD
jgi:hypothetical protein